MKTYLIGNKREPLEKIERVINESGVHDTHIFISENMTPQDLATNVSDAEVLVVGPLGVKHLSKEHLEHMPKLKFISTLSVGTHWLDIAGAKELGIIVSNEKGVNSEAVAEHAFAMILSLSKRLAQVDRDIHSKSIREREVYKGFELYEKTIGIIGLGDIGKRIARIAGGFNMHIIGMNKSKKPVQGATLVDLGTLVKESDVIVVTVPQTDETKNMLSFKEFDLMKDRVILVSFSPEDVINKDAMLQALESGKLFGYGRDISINTLMEGSEWLNHKNVIATPHTASATEEAEKGNATMAAENINAFLQGRPIRVVN